MSIGIEEEVFHSIHLIVLCVLWGGYVEEGGWSQNVFNHITLDHGEQSALGIPTARRGTGTPFTPSSNLAIN